MKLVNCKELQDGGLYAGQSNNEAFNINHDRNGRINDDFLCPVGLEVLPLKGNFGSETF